MAGANAWFAVLLAATLAVLFNLVGTRLYVRSSVATQLYGELSERTRQLLRSTEGDIELISFFERRHPLAAPVTALLQEFTEATRTIPNLRVRTSVVDPNRDVAAATDVARRYAAAPNSLIVRAPNNHRVLAAEDLLGEATGVGREARPPDFTGEAAVAAAIWNATRASRPVVYFLTGNGEHDPSDYDRLTGYSTVARHLRRDGFVLRPVNLSEAPAAPDDCALLVIAGPRTTLNRAAIERIGTYLSTGGRVLLMLDSVADVGLQGLLADWGLTPLLPRRKSASTGAVEASHEYGEHPITRALTRVETAFEAPCRLAVRADALHVGHAHKPHVTVLVSPAPWPDPELGAEALPDIALTAIAVAVERGTRSGTEDGHLARMVVVGDAQFAANAMAGGGYDGNRDFFLSAVHWLVEQDVLIGRLPATFRILRSGIAPDGWWKTALLIGVAWPAAIGLFGLLVTYRRRDLG